jgi:hypothetical protein
VDVASWRFKAVKVMGIKSNALQAAIEKGSYIDVPGVCVCVCVCVCVYVCVCLSVCVCVSV